MRPILLMLLAALLIGSGISVLAASDLPSLSPLAFSNLGSAAVMAAYGLWRRTPPGRVDLRPFAILVTLDLSQSVLYLLALRLGPLGPVAGLHLSVPLIYLAWEILRQQRHLGRRELSVAGLLVLAIAAAVWSMKGGQEVAPLLALVMALASAIILAVLFRLVECWASGPALVPMSFARSLLIGLILLPTLSFQPLDLGQGALALALGLLLGPAVLLYWYAAARLRPTVFGSLLLTEAIWTALAAALLFGRAFPWSSALSGALILAAVLLELQQRPPDSADRHEISSQG